MLKAPLMHRPEDVGGVVDPRLYTVLEDANMVYGLVDRPKEEDTMHALVHRPHPIRYWEWVRCTLAGSLLGTFLMLIATLITIPFYPNNPVYPKMLKFFTLVCVVHACILYEDAVRAARIARRNGKDLAKFFLAILAISGVVSALVLWFFFL
jgi:hypothetical protein